MFFFAFETVAWKLFLSLRSVILKMWSLEFWCLSRANSEDCYSLRLWKGFFHLLTHRYRNHVNSFNQTGRKRLFFLTGSLCCDSKSAMFYQLTFCPRMPHNKTLVPKPQMSNVVPWSEHQKSKLENLSNWVWLFLVLKQESDKKRRLKSLYI